MEPDPRSFWFLQVAGTVALAFSVGWLAWMRTVAMSAWALPFIMPVRPAPALYLEMDRMTDRIHHHEA
jgi:hypothetical protein